MLKKLCLLCIFLFCHQALLAQKETPPAIDTSITDYDELFSELDDFLDSVMQPGSFVLFNTGLTTNFFNYENKRTFEVETKRKFVFSPSLAYYHKSGVGISAGASVIKEGSFNPYQFTLTASYDYLNNRKFSTGVSFTRFFTKDSLKFYTSPLQNQLYAYFTYRNFFVRPTIGVSYGWGSRSAYTEQVQYIQSIRLRRRGYTRVNTTESINDFSLIGSLRHDFYWLDVLAKKDFIRFTPQISFIGGTQRFGFNQSSNTYGTTRGTGANVLFNSENINLDDQTYFQPVSLTLFLKSEYSVGKFFIQPQVMFDYYFPAATNQFSTIWLVNVGLVF